MRTRKVDVVENYHGTMVADPYRWLENAEDRKYWIGCGARVRLRKSFSVE